MNTQTQPLTGDYKVFELVCSSENIPLLFDGKDSHTPAMKLAAQFVNRSQDRDLYKRLVRAALPEGYPFSSKNNTLEELDGFFDSGVENCIRDKGEKGKPDASEIIAPEMEDVEFFPDSEKTTYMTYPNKNGARITCLINSGAGKAQIRQKYYAATGKAIKGQALLELIGLYEARALHDDECKEVFLRTTEHNGKIYVDIGDEIGSVVCITTEGWDIIKDCPVKFLRPKGYKRLPLPDKDGAVTLLRDILGIDPDNWSLLLAFLISALHPTGPYFHLMVEGEHGSGKSLITYCIKSLLDPATAMKAILPKNERDLMVIANSNRLLSFDNLSQISGVMSDVFCNLATGGGMITRGLYTNAEPFIVNCTRPVIMNGITSMIHRPDLMDRTIPVLLSALPEGSRKPEAALLGAFYEAQPKILGGLYTIISTALRNRDTVDAPTNIRMADCAKWLVAAEPATGLPPGTFIRAIHTSQKEFVAEQMSTNPLALAFLRELQHRPYEGTVGKLHERLITDADYKTKEMIGHTSAHFSSKLKRLKSSLETVGIKFEFGSKKNKGKFFRAWLVKEDVETAAKPKKD
jgi:hypothetical protein